MSPKNNSVAERIARSNAMKKRGEALLRMQVNGNNQKAEDVKNRMTHKVIFSKDRKLSAGSQ